MGDHRSARQGRPHPDGDGPIWIKQAIDTWITAAKIEKGRLLRPLSKSGKMVGDELGDWAIWSVVEQSSKQIGIEHFGAHDLRRTCAKLCRKNGGGMEQIKFLLSHSLIQNYGALPRFRTGNLRGHE
jgi:integrase